MRFLTGVAGWMAIVTFANLPVFAALPPRAAQTITRPATQPRPTTAYSHDRATHRMIYHR